MATKIDKETVRKIALLSRLSSNPSDEFLEKYANELSNILTYVEELQAVNTEGVLATDIFRTVFIDDLREDVEEKNVQQYQQIRNNIIQNFPKKQGNLLLIPVRIVE